jgi:hypothetical protein
MKTKDKKKLFFFAKKEEKQKEENISSSYRIDFKQQSSLIDTVLKNNPAQLATSNGLPKQEWIKVKTKLEDLDTSKLHYVKLETNHIVIDFDIKDENGKCLESNIIAASKFPPTYSELSKSGSGIHLHYIYNGDVTTLLNKYDEDIEIKIFNGGASLRRKLTKCNNLSIKTISSGLPLKGVIKMLDIKNEMTIRNLIRKNLTKSIHPGTKPSIDFINKILEDSFNNGEIYDVTDLRPSVMAFANGSTNHAQECLKIVSKMKFKSEKENVKTSDKDKEIVFFDVEVFPNLFILVWKPLGKPPVRMINPTGSEIEQLFKFNLIGFNNRRYDNHILYARYIGYTLEQLFTLSQRIISGSPNSFFSEAYNISYTDIYDFSSEKKSLKKFEIELGITHMELGLPWTEPVPENLWDKVAEYCENDVVATEKVFENRKQDYVGRLILSELSGLTPNDTTQQHAAKILFGDERNPQSKFIYTDLSNLFPGYKYENGLSTYKNNEIGEGGWVYSEPGMYKDVAVLDVASMHPNSLIQLNAFGPYTKILAELVDTRIAVKHGDFDKASKMLNGILKKYLTDKKVAKDLSYALKIIINIIYGLTSAKFDNKFRDPRNIDNIVAKRGALFMVDLKEAVEAKGFTVAHIKTDSIKIPNATPEIINFVMEFGKSYGYTFEHESTYSRFCLVNDAVYIAKNGEEWEATGAQFAHPIVYKKLFSFEDIKFEDYCETKSVTTAMYLYYPEIETRMFIGKVGSFVPVVTNGGILERIKDEKYYAVSGTKGYRFIESERYSKEFEIDTRLSQKLVDDALKKIKDFGNYDWLINEEPNQLSLPPWEPSCGTKERQLCNELCPCYSLENINGKQTPKCKLNYDLLPF